MDTAKYLTTHRTAYSHKEFSSTKCQVQRLKTEIDKAQLQQERRKGGRKERRKERLGR